MRPGFFHYLGKDGTNAWNETMLLKCRHNWRCALDAEDRRRMVEIGAYSDACCVIRIPLLLASGAYHNGSIRQVIAPFAGLRPCGFHETIIAYLRHERRVLLRSGATVYCPSVSASAEKGENMQANSSNPD